MAEKRKVSKAGGGRIENRERRLATTHIINNKELTR